MANQPNPRPVTKITDGRLSASVWRNESEKREFYAVTFSRVYVDADGNLQNSTSFSNVELLKLSRLAMLAYDEVKRLTADNGDDEDRGE